MFRSKLRCFVFIFMMVAAVSMLGCEGDTGLAGAAGVAGADGADGEQGPAGADGADGAVGAAGVAGADGAVGAAGVAGADGADGEQGPAGTGIEDPAEFEAADAVRGGQLYDKWWVVTGAAAPTTAHDLYPTFGQKSVSDSWRCKECHGWDYIGKDGRYSGGSHYTGVDGLYPATLSAQQAFDVIGVDHGYTAAGLADADIWDLVKFYREGMIDVGDILNSDGSFDGDPGAGKDVYNDGISGYDDTTGTVTENTNCVLCHDADGLNAITIHGPGYLANDNPQEFLHKVLYGHPGTAMPQAAEIHASLSDIADLAAYSRRLPENIDWAGTDVAKGGQLYDKFWSVAGVTAAEPVTDHDLYPSSGGKTLGDTWRCKECHGWDYIGKDGRYKSGSHYTGVEGLYPSMLTRQEAFDEIKYGHGYGAAGAGLTDAEIRDLASFVAEGMLDIDDILNPDGAFSGDETAGQDLYDNGIGGGASCALCHDADGLNPITADGPGALSNDNPQEFQHKARFGHPGSSMVKTYDDGSTVTNIADLGAYSQTLPTE